MLMRKSIYSRKKSTLIAILAALAICGTLSVSAADSTEEQVGDTLDLTTSDTTHKNKVTNTGKSKNDTIAIGFDNTAANGGLAIGSNNTVSNAARMHLATAIGRNNTANNDSVVVGHSNPGSAAVPSSGSITTAALMPRYSVSILKRPVALQSGTEPEPVLSRFLISRRPRP